MYGDWLFNSIQKASGVLIIDGDEHITTEEARRRIARFQDAAEHFGIKKGDRVAVMPKRSAEWVLFLHALLLLEAVPTLIDHRIDPSLVLAGEEYLVFEGIDTKLDNITALSFEQIKKFVSKIRDTKLRSKGKKTKDDTVMVVHTSGTTGRPKRVAYTYTNLHWALSRYYEIYNLRDRGRILFSLPFHYCYSVIPCCLTPIMYGNTVVILPEGSTNRDVVNLIASEKIHILAATPSLYKDLAKFDIESVDLSSLRVCDSGGESIPPAITKLLEERSNVRVTEGYGLSETTSLTHFMTPEGDGTVRYGSVGRPLMGVGCKIVDETYNIAPRGSIGELCIQGPMVATYEERLCTADDGWFYTGDYFYEDQQGYYYFVSRKKEATEVDPAFANIVHDSVPALALTDGITDVAYVMHDGKELEILYSGDVSGSSEELVSAMKEQLPYELGKALFRRVSQIPRNTNGKVILDKVRK